MIALFELFLLLTYIYDIRRQMQIYGAHGARKLINQPTNASAL